MESFTCPQCSRVTRHPMDIKHRYCPGCHIFTNDPQPLTPFQVKAFRAMQQPEPMQALTAVVVERRAGSASMLDIHTELSHMVANPIVSEREFGLLATVLGRIVGFCHPTEKIA